MTTPGLLGHLYQIDEECRRVRMQPGDLLIFHSFTHHAGTARFVCLVSPVYLYFPPLPPFLSRSLSNLYA